MSVLRMVRNLAVLAILAVGGLSLTSRSNAAPVFCPGAPSCGPHIGSCFTHCCDILACETMCTYCVDLDTNARCKLHCFHRF
jgi:hypothetical protein